MYEDDTPPAERRAQALSLDRDLLRELLGQEELRELIDADALADVEASLRPRPRNPDHLHDVLRLRGDYRVGEFDEAHAAILEARGARCACGSRRRAADRGRGCGPLSRRARRDAAVGPAGGVPRGRAGFAAAARRCGTRAVGAVHDGAGRTRGSASTSSRTCASSSATRSSCAASCVPAGSSASGAIPDVLRRLRRASLAALRREVEPTEQAALGLFLPHWHGIDRRGTLREALIPLQGSIRALHRSRPGHPLHRERRVRRLVRRLDRLGGAVLARLREGSRDPLRDERL